LAIPPGTLLYGKGKGIYRIIFDIREHEQRVRVLRVWIKQSSNSASEFFQEQMATR
jgi:hypothetical protein